LAVQVALELQVQFLVQVFFMPVAVAVVATLK
jgi:hypothetical protein